jgi:hypothetical protein
MPVWHAGSPAGCEVREPMSFPAGILWGGRNEYKKRTGTNRWGGSRRYCYPHCQALGWLKAVRGRPLVGMPEKVRANRVVDRIMWITFIATNVFGETARAFQFGDDIYVVRVPDRLMEHHRAWTNRRKNMNKIITRSAVC